MPSAAPVHRLVLARPRRSIMFVVGFAVLIIVVDSSTLFNTGLRGLRQRAIHVNNRRLVDAELVVIGNRFGRRSADSSRSTSTGLRPKYDYDSMSERYRSAGGDD